MGSKRSSERLRTNGGEFAGASRRLPKLPSIIGLEAPFHLPAAACDGLINADAMSVARQGSRDSSRHVGFADVGVRSRNKQASGRFSNHVA